MPHPLSFLLWGNMLQTLAPEITLWMVVTPHPEYFAPNMPLASIRPTSRAGMHLHGTGCDGRVRWSAVHWVAAAGARPYLGGVGARHRRFDHPDEDDRGARDVGVRQPTHHVVGADTHLDHCSCCCRKKGVNISLVLGGRPETFAANR